MKINIKDRKLLMLFLGLIIVSFFTLTIAYAAPSIVLTISGSATNDVFIVKYIFFCYNILCERSDINEFNSRNCRTS